MTQWGWAVDRPWLYFHQDWYMAVYEAQIGPGLDYIPPDNFPDPQRAEQYGGNVVQKDWHYFGPSELDYAYFEKISRWRRPFDEIFEFYELMLEQTVLHEGTIEERNWWVYSFLLQTSESWRQRVMGIQLLEWIVDRQYPPSPMMVFQITFCRIRSGAYALAMNYMKFSRRWYPGYGRNVALEKYLHRKIEEKAWNRLKWSIQQCTIIGVLFLVGGHIAVWHWRRHV